MSNTFTAPFVQNYRTKAAVVTAAIPVTQATVVTGMMALATAGVNGAVVTKLTAIPRATVTASGLMLWLKKPTDAVPYLIDSELMAAYTQAATTAIPETVFTNINDETPIRLEVGDVLYVGSEVALAAGIVFKAEWGDL